MLGKPSANGVTSTASELKIKIITFGGEKKGDKSGIDFKVVIIFCHTKLEGNSRSLLHALFRVSTLATRLTNT